MSYCQMDVKKMKMKKSISFIIPIFLCGCTIGTPPGGFSIGHPPVIGFSLYSPYGNMSQEEIYDFQDKLAHNPELRKMIAPPVGTYKPNDKPGLPSFPKPPRNISQEKPN